MALSQRHLIRFTAWLCFFSSSAFCATAQNPSTQQDIPATFRLIALGASEPFLYDISAGKPRHVYYGTNAFSDPLPIPNGGMLNFYRLGESTDPKLPPPRIPVAEIRVSTTETRSILIVLIPGGLPGKPLPILANGKPAEFSALVLDNSDTASPANTMRVVSFSKRPTAVRWGPTVLQLNPFESKLIPYPEGTRARFELATFLGNQWAPVISNTQMISQGTKLTLFITDPRTASNTTDLLDLDIQQIVEVLPPPSPNGK
ncbi:MAG: hypothetical protein WC205_00020 [Opitutaceae bacterium]|jgi:hypothetical protein